jgi:hypothetical protein
MGTSDRLYELCLECREAESALEKLRLDAERDAARLRAAGELAEAVEGLRVLPSVEVSRALAGFRLLN